MLIGAGAIAIYAGTFSAPFVFDDLGSIVTNPTLRHLWLSGDAWRPPAGALTVSGRPLLNESFALNYAVSGTAVWSYHLANLTIHVLAALALFGIARRTLDRMGGVPRPAVLAFFVATLWAMHPLQTEAVTYVVQRAESLMGLFYLLTLYCSIRAMERSGWAWTALAVVACLAAALTKEVIVSAPLVVLIYDRTFVSRGWPRAFQAHWRLYAGLILSWPVLAYLVAGNGGDRGGSAGFGTEVVWVHYWVTQGEAVLRYLWLSLWPVHQVFVYGPLPPRTAAVSGLCILLVVAAFVASVVGVLKGRGWGFLGASFFLILAPTSLIPGTMQEVVEHRMYLPLACVVSAFVIGAVRGASKRSFGRMRTGVVLGSILVLAAGGVTWARNADYQSAEALWRSNVVQRPGAAQGQAAYAQVLAAEGRGDEADRHFQVALALSPPAERHTDLGLALDQAGRPGDALAEYQAALHVNPRLGFTELRAGRDLYQLGRYGEAEKFVRAGIGDTSRIGPAAGESQLLLGATLGQLGRPAEAVAAFQAAVALEPESAVARGNLATALDQAGRTAEAIAQYRRLLALTPNYAEGHYNLGNALLRSGQAAAAHVEFEKALVINPLFSEAREMFQRTTGR